ncbi:DUF4402 domain-containing protein [Psychromonas hadalis]|uniref:DUF4402 domain-containing protein n=1 Tax=Psychromonas hadalis TaxID=211669 RepID=UPI0003B512C2|nr:DUF4402 domain-containing protein [Psychromonas hadalis]
MLKPTDKLSLQYIGKFIALFFAFSPFSYANEQLITEQPLSFGIIAIAKSPHIKQLTVNTDGQLQHSKGIYILQPGHVAKFSLIGYPANTMLMINATIIKPAMDINNSLKLIKIITKQTVTTDGTGFATIIVGGTLQSTGQPKNLDKKANYQAQIAIDIHY